MNRRILVLAGTSFQIPVIESAKRLGCAVITCDNRPDNPGHRLADAYENVSTTDIEGVEKVARQHGVDGILAYASDPAAIPAAEVAERLGLPGNSVASVKKLGLKSEYRRLQRKLQIPHPEFTVLRPSRDTSRIEVPFDFPVVVKPTDSSGSRGVSIARNESALTGAVEFACRSGRNGEVIVEEYVKSDHAQIVGEAFILDGDVVMLDIGDHELNVSGSGLVPIGGVFPSVLWDQCYDRIREQLSRVLESCGFANGALNIEVRIGSENNVYLMEVGPRSGGNFLPELMKYTVGADVATASVKAALGDMDVSACFPPLRERTSLHGYFVHHVSQPGLFSAIQWDQNFSANHVVAEFVFKREGEPVPRFSNSGDLLGVVLLRFGDRASARSFFADPSAVVSYHIPESARGQHYDR
ncbi:MAG TPA: ATP-grasp domain-containing protein [bacterium]|nr:ATP-grasp domain-containing protein [bacterium]